MPFTVTVRGTSYTLPSPGDTDWGAKLQSWMSAVSAGPPAFINVQDPLYGALGNGVADDSAAIAAAIAAAASVAGGEVFLPAGTYMCHGLTLPNGIKITGVGRGRTVLKCNSAGASIFQQTATYSPNHLEISHLTLDGNANTSGHLINFAPASGFSYSNFLHDMDVSNSGGKGIYMPAEFSTRLDNVHVGGGARVSDGQCTDNAIELQGGSATALYNCYVHNVASGKYGYRITSSGFPVFVNCNGLDGGGNWGSFGTDAGSLVCRPTFIGCNFEVTGAPTDAILDFNSGSSGSFFGCTWFNDTALAMKAIRYYGPTQAGILDATCVFGGAGGGSWTNGYSVHCRTGGQGLPFWNLGATDSLGSLAAMQEDGGSVWTLPSLSSGRISGTTIFDISISSAQLPSLNLLVMGNKVTGAPGSPTTGRIYQADGSGWDPLSRGAGKPYLVYYDGSAYKAVSAA